MLETTSCFEGAARKQFFTKSFQSRPCLLLSPRDFSRGSTNHVASCHIIRRHNITLHISWCTFDYVQHNMSEHDGHTTTTTAAPGAISSRLPADCYLPMRVFHCWNTAISVEFDEFRRRRRGLTITGAAATTTAHDNDNILAPQPQASARSQGFDDDDNNQ